MTDTAVDSHVAVYRHDAHKFLRRSHEARHETYQGLRVNESVTHGADSDAAALSREGDEPSTQLDAHTRHDRLSLFTGRPVGEDGSYAPHDPEFEQRLRTLLAAEDPEAAHRAWLHGRLPAVFNESVHYPYTSLKYHTLLTAALFDAYERGCEFEDLSLVIDVDGRVEPHRTIYASERFALRIDADTPPNRSTTLGDRPSCSWSTVWNTLPEHPFDVSADRFDMVLDAQLRRIRSWSTALQYLEDFDTWRPAR